MSALLPVLVAALCVAQPAPSAVPVPAAGSPVPAASGEMEYFEITSKALGETVDVGAYLPPGFDREQTYPMLVFLHGMFGDQRKWESRGVPAILDGLINSGKVPPMIVICPDGGRNSMYVDWKNGKADWMRFLVEDLPGGIEERYPVAKDRKLRGITGDSMGGYGALNLAFQHPDLYGSVSAHSAALYPVDPAQLPQQLLDRAEHWKDIFGFPIDVEMWEKNNPLHLAQTLEPEKLKSMSIYFDVGTDDRYGLDATNVQLDEILTERGVEHEFHLRDGGHGREFFGENVAHSLEFHGKAFKEAQAGAPKEF